MRQSTSTRLQLGLHKQLAHGALIVADVNVSTSALVGVSRFVKPSAPSLRTTAPPARPRPPATRIDEALFTMRGHAEALLRDHGIAARDFAIARDHLRDELFEGDFRLPTEDAPCLAGVT